MRAVATKSLVIWPRACWPEGCFLATGDPVRRFPWSQGVRHAGRQKAPSTKRCIKTPHVNVAKCCSLSQKAPSTKRCIKTCSTIRAMCPVIVRRHRAPNGALRLFLEVIFFPFSFVRKHRAPKGALRHQCTWRFPCHPGRQKAPSAKRYIKTALPVLQWTSASPVRKHRAPKGALRPEEVLLVIEMNCVSEGTERQKVH